MKHTVNVTIVEDDFLIADFIRKSLVAFGYNVTELCNSYDSFINAISQTMPDIALIDIKIDGEKSGIDIAEYLRDNKNLPFIFISSLNDRKTIDAAKKTFPAAYLIKPFDEDDLYAAIEVALTNFSQRHNMQLPSPTEDSIVLKNAIFIKQKQAFVKVNKTDIFYVEAKDNYVKLYTKDDSFMIRQPMYEIQQILPFYFYKVHRSFMVNVNYIQQVHNEELILINDIKIPLSRSNYTDLMAHLQTLKS